MQEETSTQDLKERLALIEKMIAEGRRSTESWSWVFLLWGVAYYVAIGWASWGRGLSVWGSHSVEIGSVRSGLAWPVTMIVAFFVTLAIGLRKGKGRPGTEGKGRTGTTMSRAIVSIWMAVGISMFVLFPALAIVGRLDQHAFVALVAAMLGAANGASGFILRWKWQVACGVVWWITSAAACFGSDVQLAVVFLGAIFLCQIVFGFYVMILESRRNRRSGVVHA